MAKLVKLISIIHLDILASVFDPRSWNMSGIYVLRDRLIAAVICKYVKHRETSENAELQVFDSVNQMQS